MAELKKVLNTRGLTMICDWCLYRFWYLCDARGAYMEKERERAAQMGYRDPIQPDKESSDRDFNLALEYCVQHNEDISICCGSHNVESSIHLTQLMRANGIGKDDKGIFFAQLFGMSDHISCNLAHAGYNVAKYVPYGPINEASSLSNKKSKRKYKCQRPNQS